MATPADEVNGGFKVDKLTGEKYYSWKFQMKMALVGKDLWDIVTGDEELDDTAEATQQRKLQRRENVALATICLSVSQNIQIYVRSAKGPKEAWDNLESHFEKRSLSQKIYYRHKIYSGKLERGTTMLERVNHVQTLSDHLEAVGDPIEEKDLVIILISSLTEDYNHLITALETIAEDRLSWVYVRDRVLHEYEKLHGSTEVTTNRKVSIRVMHCSLAGLARRSQIIHVRNVSTVKRKDISLRIAIRRKQI